LLAVGGVGLTATATDGLFEATLLFVFDPSESTFLAMFLGSSESTLLAMFLGFECDE
jgi:hypothetical protein